MTAERLPLVCDAMAAVVQAVADAQAAPEVGDWMRANIGTTGAEIHDALRTRRLTADAVLVGTGVGYLLVARFPGGWHPFCLVSPNRLELPAAFVAAELDRIVSEAVPDDVSSLTGDDQ